VRRQGTLTVPLVAGLATSGAALAYYLSLPGRTLASAVQEITALAGTRVLSSVQQQQVNIIAAEFGVVGLSWLVPAAVCNAYAESRLNPEAIGDNGYAVGLFQLNSASSSAAGYGMTTEERKDPRINCRRIIEVIQGPGGAALRAARGREPNHELTVLFARDIERCNACGHAGGDAELDHRRELTYELYGDAVADAVPT
jgi:hypothetical protein